MPETFAAVTNSYYTLGVSIPRDIVYATRYNVVFTYIVDCQPNVGDTDFLYATTFGIYYLYRVPDANRTRDIAASNVVPTRREAGDSCLDRMGDVLLANRGVID
jgi:hypothetical protein